MDPEIAGKTPPIPFLKSDTYAIATECTENPGLAISTRRYTIGSRRIYTSGNCN